MTQDDTASYDAHFDMMAEKFGGRRALQDLLQVGPSALSNYRNRGHIPTDKMQRLQSEAARLGFRLNPDTLEFIKSKPPVILLIITGGVAAYKALELARRLGDAGAIVRGVMTKSAQEFITPLALSALTAEKTYTDLFDLTDEQEMGHIRLAREADLVLVAPATANFIAKMAHGMADDLASTLCLASTAPIAIAPAMNPAMWIHPATQANLDILANRGIQIIGPDSGDTACGEIGTGRLTAPDEIARTAMMHIKAPEQPLSGQHIIVTSGPTFEPIDPVRFIGNQSSGQQGHDIARACAGLGAQVTLVSGPVALPDPEHVETIHIQTAEDMLKAVTRALPATSFISCAAVADWRPVQVADHKIKKQHQADVPMIELMENPDILAQISKHKDRPELVVGFAAETENLVANATKKRHRKGCDWILANPVHQDGRAVFGASLNDITYITGLHGIITIFVHQVEGIFQVALVVESCRRCLVVHHQLHALRVSIFVEHLDIKVTKPF